MSTAATLIIASVLAIAIFGPGCNRRGRLIAGGASLVFAPVAWLIGETAVHAWAGSHPEALTRGEWVTLLRWAQLVFWLAPFAIGLVLMRKTRRPGRLQTSVPNS